MPDNESIFLEIYKNYGWNDHVISHLREDCLLFEHLLRNWDKDDHIQSCLKSGELDYAKSFDYSENYPILDSILHKLVVIDTNSDYLEFMAFLKLAISFLRDEKLKFMDKKKRERIAKLEEELEELRK